MKVFCTNEKKVVVVVVVVDRWFSWFSYFLTQSKINVLPSDSTVHTPVDGDLWTLAKLNLEVTDYGYNQIVEHLLKAHLLMDPFCVVLPRHLSEDHPLHQILKFHCLGIMVTNTIGSPTLLLPGQFIHQLLAFGHRGSSQLVNLGYVEAGWHDTDFKNNIKVAWFYPSNLKSITKQ